MNFVAKYIPRAVFVLVDFTHVSTVRSHRHMRTRVRGSSKETNCKGSTRYFLKTNIMLYQLTILKKYVVIVCL